MGASPSKSFKALCAGAVLLAIVLPARAGLDLAEDMTCEQAIAYYAKNHVIYIITDGKFVTPLKAGPSVRDPPSPQCHVRGFWFGGIGVRTRDRWRCTIAWSC